MRRTCSRSLHSNCLGRGSNTYSPRYRPSTLTNRPPYHTKRGKFSHWIRPLLFSCHPLMSHSLAEYGLTAYISVSQTVVRGPLVLRTQVVCNTTASAPMRQYYIRSILAQTPTSRFIEPDQSAMWTQQRHRKMKVNYDYNSDFRPENASRLFTWKSLLKYCS